MFLKQKKALYAFRVKSLELLIICNYLKNLPTCTNKRSNPKNKNEMENNWWRKGLRTSFPLFNLKYNNANPIRAKPNVA